MKGLLSILVFLCLILMSTQDVASIDICRRDTNVKLSSVEKTIKDRALQQHHESVFDLAENCDYIHILSKLSRERNNSNNSLRSENKYHSDQLLKDFNIRQRTCELISTLHIIDTSSLHYRFAHFIYELRRIII
ncbi:hypothetical protein AALM74_09080 [Parabacteroides segnis]|jgi:hypothetical protein|uniref:Uncharacterized protein n=1 Tax=Parabacteroides segnis TaxID=2763058 RepID=A0ABR7DW37_9BACT|nr:MULTISPECIES: hypothetical protein [Parabacteroides]MBC5641729.1 hypothetical protein [Parabacteroides segnis]MCM0711373.1 hypothetical protein [Parabacteroides sp. TA-V-105]